MEKCCKRLKQIDGKDNRNQILERRHLDFRKFLGFKIFSQAISWNEIPCEIRIFSLQIILFLHK